MHRNHPEPADWCTRARREVEMDRGLARANAPACAGASAVVRSAPHNCSCSKEKGTGSSAARPLYRSASALADADNLQFIGLAALGLDGDLAASGFAQQGT